MDFIQKLFPFFNFFLCNTLGSLYHGGTRKSCLSGIAPPRIKRGEGSFAFLTNAVRWHSMQGRANPGTSIFAHTFLRPRGALPRLREGFLTDSAPAGRCAKPEQTFTALAGLVQTPVFFRRGLDVEPRRRTVIILL